MEEYKTKTFVEKAKAIHKDKYNYSKCIYVSAKTKVELICEKHGSFLITPNNHLSGKGCKSCGFESSKKKQSMSLDDFLIKAKEIHNDKYEYSKVIMNGVDRPVTIICRIHGEFQQTPWRHYAEGNGCTSCGIISRADLARFTLEDFITKAKEVHGDLYDYSKVVYSSSQEYVIIICKIHGEFNQVPNSHLQGCGCKKCGEKSAHDKQRFTTAEFIERATKVHQGLYDYSKVDWIDSKNEVTIICKKHGEFKQLACNHFAGFGCKRCTNVYNLDDFIEKAREIHGNLYDYSDCIYEYSINLMKIKCTKCNNVFEQSANSHLCGRGCSICQFKTEARVYNYLSKLYNSVETQLKIEDCKFKRLLPFDICITYLKIIIEIDGRQHFKQVRDWIPPDSQRRRDVFKMRKAIDAGYKVIRIFQEDIWNNDEKWLDDHLLPHIQSTERDSVFISSFDDIYDEHIKLLESDIEIKLNDLEDINDINSTE